MKGGQERKPKVSKGQETNISRCREKEHDRRENKQQTVTKDISWVFSFPGFSELLIINIYSFYLTWIHIYFWHPETRGVRADACILPSLPSIQGLSQGGGDLRLFILVSWVLVGLANSSVTLQIFHVSNWYVSKLWGCIITPTPSFPAPLSVSTAFLPEKWREKHLWSLWLPPWDLQEEEEGFQQEGVWDFPTVGDRN